MVIIVAATIGFIMDFILGDPRFLPHPIRLIGWIISKGEIFMRMISGKSKIELILAGFALTLFTLTLSFMIPYVILNVAKYINPILAVFIESIFCYQILATKALKDESMKVQYYLALNDIDNSRKYLSYIVGRDTAHLNETQIVKATLETVAENTADGVIAPLIFMAIGGAPLAFLYKAVNTLDSMIGYKNVEYIYFGRAAAKIDDFVNFIPAILSAYFMIASSFVLKMDYKNAFKIYKRDKYNHASPNSAKTEAVCAGALNIQLGGSNYYFGKLVEKPTIGDNTRKTEIDDIKSANNLLYATAVMAFLVLFGIRMIGVWLI